MSSLFGALSNIHVDVDHRTASFEFADIKINMVEGLMQVDETLLDFERYNNAMDQLDAVVASIESMGGMVDEGVMRLVNQDNQLGKLFGIYIPESLRFEMADGDNANAQGNGAATGNAEQKATDAEKKETGTSVVDKAKELAKKMWEMLKEFFSKIARGLKSFWDWLMNGFMTTKASNEKLLAAIKADAPGYAKLNKALQEAQGFIDASMASTSYTKSQNIAGKISSAPIIVAMDNSDCSKVMLDLNAKNIWQQSITELLGGIDEASLKDVFLKATPAGEGGLLPTIAVDKETIAGLKKNKAAMSTKGWTPELVIAVIETCNLWYDNISKIKQPAFIEASGKYDWENSEYVKNGKVEPKMAKKQCQAVCKFYTQFCKVLAAGVDVLQAHINALKKPFNVAAGQQTAAPNVNTSDVTNQNQQGGTTAQGGTTQQGGTPTNG